MSATPIAAAKRNRPITIQATLVVITNATTHQIRVLNKDLACVSITCPLALTLLRPSNRPPLTSLKFDRPFTCVKSITYGTICALTRCSFEYLPGSLTAEAQLNCGLDSGLDITGLMRSFRDLPKDLPKSPHLACALGSAEKVEHSACRPSSPML